MEYILFQSFIIITFFNIIQLMDSVHEAEQPGDVGVCHEHSRVFECYCNVCYCMICPSCLMFGLHKGHDVSKIQQGSKQLRSSINLSAKQGFLKFDRTENVLLDIRHVKLSLQQNQQKILKQVQSNFDELISILKNRKNSFIKEIKDHFNEQITKVQETEADWVRKQQLSQKILQLQTSKDDIKIMEQGRNIVQGLKQLAKPLEYKQVKLIQSIKPESTHGKNTINFTDIKQILKNFMQRGSPTLNKLKC